MILEANDLMRLRDAAIDAVRSAARVVGSWNGAEVEVSCKSGGDTKASQVVTEVDLLSQTAILETLAGYSREYDLGILTEEASDDGGRFKNDYFWCVDPLDGTLPFTEGRSGYAISVALVSRDGVPVLGVVMDPCGDQLFEAVKGEGCRVDGTTFRVADTPSEKDWVSLFCDRSLQGQSGYEALRARLDLWADERGYEGVKEQVHGGAVMNACWSLLNQPACYFKLPKKAAGGGSLWDFAATACIFEEAGAWASDIVGDRLDLNRRDSTFLNHRGVLFSTDRRLADCIHVAYTDLKASL